MAALSRGRSSSPSPYGYRRPYPSSSSSSSSSSFVNGRIVPRSSPSSVSSTALVRSATPSRARSASWDFARAPRAAVADDILLDDPPRSASGAAESICVTVRFRPLSEREFQRGDEIAWYADGDKIVRSEYNPATSFAFDKVFGPATNSKSVYEVAARPVVKAAMEGINGTVFAYGVTSSGKTHTMHGDQNSPGIVPLAIKDVFSIIQDTPGREFLLRVSYLEIYNEVINDLLDPTGQNLRVREDTQGTYVEGIKEEVVLSPGHALSFIAAGEEHRHVGSNNFNLFSSRSHTIFTLMIESSAHGDEYDGVTFSQLNLIDLAGSESSKTETTGLRRKEGSYINKSLLTLGTVIGKLSDGKASHIPYRDSKLTRLLQSSLSGNGHVSLICTVTPASSNSEETHNTLKFASRAKRVEIYASRNRIIDEKSLIKKYQKEISTLKLELDQLKRGIIVGVSQEEIISLRQQLEEGQVKMQSRLEEEEEAKAALMSRIQRLTKLILVSTKNTIPGYLSDVPAHRGVSSGEEDKLEILREASPLLLQAEGSVTDRSAGLKYQSLQRNSNNDQPGNSELNQYGEPNGNPGDPVKIAVNGITVSDQMDLFVEQVKMLAGEIAFGTSTLKRLVEQSINDPDSSSGQIELLEREIHEKQRQMRALEQQILECSEASFANASFVDMQQTIMKLMTQCNEKSFDLELRTADNRILQEQLQEKYNENIELRDKIVELEKHLNSVMANKVSQPSDPCISEEFEGLKRKIQLQDIENEKLDLQRARLLEENNALQIQNQKLADEASYAKELASAAAVELKNLAEEVTKLSLQNARQAKELQAVQSMTHSRSGSMQNINGSFRRHTENKFDNGKLGRRSRPSSRGSDIVHDDAANWNLDLEDMKLELQARKQRETALEAALAEKDLVEEEYRRKYEEAKKRELALENDLAGMWVLVAKLKRGVLGVSELNVDDRCSYGTEIVCDNKEKNNERVVAVLKERQLENQMVNLNSERCNQNVEMEPLLSRLKAQIQEMKERKDEPLENGDVTSHLCKVCFEGPAATVLLPCRHFCLCKTCSDACTECPVCRTGISNRIVTFAS